MAAMCGDALDDFLDLVTYTCTVTGRKRCAAVQAWCDENKGPKRKMLGGEPVHLKVTNSVRIPKRSRGVATQQLRSGETVVSSTQPTGLQGSRVPAALLPTSVVLLDDSW